jgi:hypothetical protein
MRACLHLYAETSSDSVFYQILNEDIELKEGEFFDYLEKYYNLLDSKAKKDFNSQNLKIGKYQVYTTYIEPNDHLGEIRYLFLKPVK